MMFSFIMFRFIVATWPLLMTLSYHMITGANRVAGVDISTRLCLTFARVTCVTLSELKGEDNSYLCDANMSWTHTGKSIRTSDEVL